MISTQNLPAILKRRDGRPGYYFVIAGLLAVLLAAGFAFSGSLQARVGALAGYLPYLLLLLCPLIHVFMHRGHGAGAGNHQGRESRHGEKLFLPPPSGARSAALRAGTRSVSPGRSQKMRIREK